MSLLLPPPPSSPGWLPLEHEARMQGFLVVAGVDEVGRGCLAGPVVAAAVVLPPELHIPGVADSKQLSEKAREAILPAILQAARGVAIGQASVEEIDQLNILRATFLAMQRAIAQLSPPPDFLLIDGNQPLPGAVSQRTVVKGDSRCLSIAAASIVAKVHRDQWMKEEAARYPGYGLEKHKGYGTREHLAALARLGPSPLHRLTFRGVLPDSQEQLELPFAAATDPRP